MLIYFFYDLQSLTEEGMLKAFSALTSLQELSLFWHTRLTGARALELAKGCPTLTKLVLPYGINFLTLLFS